MFATYTEARAALDNLNARYWAEIEAGRALKIGVATEAEFAAHFEAKAAIAREAREAGFQSVAVGGYKLNKEQVALS